MVLDAEAMPVFHSAAEAFSGALNDESGYQLTSVQIDCKNLTELRSTLKQFTKISRGSSMHTKTNYILNLLIITQFDIGYTPFNKSALV